jgi:uncharacterized protein YndB with AHSA1/START domain
MSATTNDRQTHGVHMEIDIAAPVERVWTYLTDPEKLAAWLMQSDFTARVGARFTFTAPPAGGWDGAIHCEVKELVEHERLAFTWNANDIGAETLVTIRLARAADGTRLTLEHTGLETALPGAEGRHAAGWTRALKALVTALCGADPVYDWSRFRITSFIDAPCADVFTMWATADGLRRFWADRVSCTAADGSRRRPGDVFRTGDRIDLTFPTGTTTGLEIINIERDHFVRFSFGRDYGWVHVELTPDGERTRVELVQFGLPVDGEAAWEVHANARGWWIFNLMNLKSVLLYGHDLRVRGDTVASGLGARFQSDGGVAAAPHDWTAFDVHLSIDAPPEEVLGRWCSPRGIESFFIGTAEVTDASGGKRAAADTVAAGDTYVWDFIHGYRLEGRFLEVEERRIVFTFGSRYAVEVEAIAQGDGTLLRLHQSGMSGDPQDRVDGSLNCRSCWIYFLTALKGQLEHGIDLRDRVPETADAISVGYNERAAAGAR